MNPHSKVIALPFALGALLLASTGCTLLIPETTFADRDAAIDGGEVDGGVDSGPVPRDAGPDARVAPGCGNGMSDGAEACDDGNMTADDGCDACAVEDGFECTGFGAGSCSPICGDGVVVTGETCDDGFETACGVCNADCTAVGSTVVCGDGMICTDTEACDDGDTDDGDGCSMTCTVETGWVCDNDPLPSTCAETCNNGVLDAGEECDDGGNVDGDGCSAACLAEAGYTCVGAGVDSCTTMCGDGIFVALHETCDDGNTDNDDGCSADCSTLEPGWDCTLAGITMTVCTAICGDSIMVTGETCDDGNTTTELVCPYGLATCVGFGCNMDCLGVPTGLTGNVCGDGVVDVVNETCDDGDTDANDGCSDTCQLETGWTCATPGADCTAICGDSMMLGTEACDDGNEVAETACPYGTASCTACNADCSAVLNLMGNICGDGDRDVANETCDDGNTDSCGLCAAGCGSARTYAAATGSFTAGDGTAIGDGNSLTLDDGINPAVTFELDSNSDCPEGGPTGVVETPTFRCVPFVGGTTVPPATSAVIIADRFSVAINSASITLDINAVTSGADITLTNQTLSGAGNGAGGNVDIINSGLPGAWMITGMSGGVARNCGTGTGCTVANDCDTGMCTGGTCP